MSTTLKLKYIGTKGKYPIELPIGVKRRTDLKGVIWADPFVELPREKAEALLELKGDKFVIASDEAPKKRVRVGIVEKPKTPRPKKKAPLSNGLAVSETSGDPMNFLTGIE